MGFGAYVRGVRERKRSVEGGAWSLRSVARRIGIAPTYLSQIELEKLPPPSEEVIVKLAREFGESEDELLSRAGRLSTDLIQIIAERPRLLSSVIKTLENVPEKTIAQILNNAGHPLIAF